MRFRNQKSQAEDGHAELRHKMVRQQIEKRGIKNRSVLAAMRKVPRHLFTTPQYLAEAYTDHALSINCGQTISQPYIVALMTDRLQLKPTSNVLEIGTGCGYQTAVLAELVNQVYTVEIIPELAKDAQKQLNRLGYRNVDLKIGNGYFGWEEHAPYDRIIVTAAPKETPTRLIEQLAEGGRMVIPIGDYSQELMLICKTDGEIERMEVTAVRFVPMTDAPDDN